MNLAEISFPVFKLRDRKPEIAGTVTYYINENFNKDSAEYTKCIYFVDDTSLAEPTLSQRRLRLETEGVPLLKITVAIYFIADLIKSTKSTTWWIDSMGKVFQYKKTKKAKLVFLPVENIYPLPGLGAVIQVQGVPQRFKVLFMPGANEAKYAGVLELGPAQKILYGLYANYHNTTWRLV